MIKQKFWTSEINEAESLMNSFENSQLTFLILNIPWVFLWLNGILSSYFSFCLVEVDGLLDKDWIFIIDFIGNFVMNLSLDSLAEKFGLKSFKMQ